MSSADKQILFQVTGSSGTPTWFTSTADNHWVSPLSNNINAVLDPQAVAGNLGGAQGILQEFSGMGTDKPNKTIFMMGNGGHQQYQGNEVYSCDLSQNAPLWKRRGRGNAPTTDAITECASTPTGYPADIVAYADGRKSPDHTGDLTVSCRGRWFTLGMGGTEWNGVENQSQWWEFSTTTNDYINRGGGHHDPGGGTTGCANVEDEAGGRIFIVYTSNGSLPPALDIVRVSDLSILSTNNGTLPGGGCPSAYDTTNGILCAHADADGLFYCLNVNTNPTGAWTIISATGVSIPGYRSANGINQSFAWHAASNAFLTWDQGSGLVKITPTISGGIYTALNATAVTSLGGTPPTALVGSYPMHNKVNVIPDFGNGQGGVVVVPTVWQTGSTKDVFIYKLPVGGV
jgi:hypothetical protein